MFCIILKTKKTLHFIKNILLKCINLSDKYLLLFRSQV